MHWSTNVSIQTVGSGIKVSTLGSHDPVFAHAEYTEGGTAKFRNPTEMLRSAFPEKINLDDLVQEIHGFEGAWEYFYPLVTPYSLASPVFNDDVDPDFKLFRMPLPYHATPASSEEDNAPPPPQGYDPALASRLREGASARRLLSLRKRRPHRFKVRVLSCPMASLTMP